MGPASTKSQVQQRGGAGIGVPKTANRILKWRKTAYRAKKGQKTHIEFTNGQNLKIQEGFETANHK